MCVCAVDIRTVVFEVSLKSMSLAATVVGI